MAMVCLAGAQPAVGALPVAVLPLHAALASSVKPKGDGCVACAPIFPRAASSLVTLAWSVSRCSGWRHAPIPNRWGKLNRRDGATPLVGALSLGWVKISN